MNVNEEFVNLSTKYLIERLIDQLESEGIPICGTLIKLIAVLENTKAVDILEKTIYDN